MGKHSRQKQPPQPPKASLKTISPISGKNLIITLTKQLIKELTNQGYRFKGNVWVYEESGRLIIENMYYNWRIEETAHITKEEEK